MRKPGQRHSVRRLHDLEFMDEKRPSNPQPANDPSEPNPGDPGPEIPEPRRPTDPFDNELIPPQRSSSVPHGA